MIKQIIHSEKELRKLLKEEILLASGKRFVPSKEEIIEHVEKFIKNQSPDNYPIFMFVDLTFVYVGFHIELVTSSFALNKEELLKYHDELC